MLYGIAFGSNLGNRLENLRSGLSELLSRSQAKLVSASKVYETEPVECPEGSSAYLNAVIELEAAQPPHELHRIMQGIETFLGRPEKRDLNAPRQLDLDILFAGELTVCDEHLTIPHPRLHLRRFVLQPLADVCPQLVLPNQTHSVWALLTSLKDAPESVFPIASSEWSQLT
ncbi:MAG: 2-amino-4-hydroxy-6-hydroxymethyldihydropteridine diphosphokinase [Verrucomicrobiaceae bacterium]|nr:2-amino-4-hydroxy-6-hydroxymethyldihydropteridine diphosphokinase [Verrucomicrobiaceae bacterium]